MGDMLVRAGAVLVAFAVDRVFGEPPPHWHPVVWMGKVLGATGAPWSRLSPRGQLLCGTVAWIFGSSLVVGILLKPLLAWRMLRDEVDSVERALAAGLEEGCHRLSYLVAGAGFVFRTALILLTFRCGDGAPPPVRIA